ncbi:hypothetical protein [Gudongella oleilytica]|uniref:hypothetical protein n=1 Tax=Gudongella oleilytica TaxID=1582259 RepID=UPI002A360A81|nr:hypothetical protein [Gudongella oleilytica]MDY0256236.1 hypothetical protein [Gudongella oleilytica]
MSFLEKCRQRAACQDGTCQTCGNLEQIKTGLIGCIAHDKLILPEYPPYHGNSKCPDWKQRMEENEKMKTSELVSRAHENAVKHGFWNPAPSFGDAIALIHSELSEALEEARTGRDPRETYYEEKPDGSKKPCGIPSELADAMIRIADLCGHLGIDLEAAIAEKMAYNETREYKHGKKF